MKKILTFFIIPMATIASDSYHDIFEHFPEESVIRNQCTGYIEKNPKAFNANFPACKEISDLLNAIKDGKKQYVEWRHDLHMQVSQLLDSNSLFKDRDHAIVEGIAQSLANSWTFNNFPSITKRNAHKFALKSHPGLALYFASLKEESKKMQTFTFAPPKQKSENSIPIVHIPKGTKF